MKKLTILAILLVVLISCSKDEDYTDSESLSGTTWKSQVIYEKPPYTYADEYQHLLKFVGKSTFQWFLNYPSGGSDEIDDGIFSIDGNIVILNGSPMFKIEKDKMIMLDDEKVILTKQ